MVHFPSVRLNSLVVGFALVLTLSACSSDGSSNSDPEQVDAMEAPEVGACRMLKVEDLKLPTNTTKVVDCSEDHNAVTLAAGELPVAYADETWNSELVANAAFAICAKTFAKTLGADESSAMRTLLSWHWFRPSEKAWKDGARWYRCDLVGGNADGSELINLPESAADLLQPGPKMDPWMACVNSDSIADATRIPCTDDHKWRAVTTIKVGTEGDTYPGDDEVTNKTRAFCSDSVAAWLGYPADYDFAFTVFGEDEWDAGNRRSICWAKTQK
jgi:hypothetical protein